MEKTVQPESNKKITKEQVLDINNNKNNINNTPNNPIKDNNKINETERKITSRPQYPIYCNISNIDKNYIPIVNKLICNLCKGILYKPIQDKCNHLYCERCYNIFCPNPPYKCFLKGLIYEKPILINGLKLIFKEMNISCPNKCDWKGTYEELNEHKKNCWFEFIKCPFENCPYDIMRKYLENHKSSCIYRIEKCKYCNEIMQYLNLENHYLKCNKFPVDCEYSCGKKIKRNEMEYHKINECENTILDCQYKFYGCNLQYKRKNMDKHYKDNVEVHLKIFENFMNKYIPVLNEIESVFLKKKRSSVNKNNNVIFLTEEENGNDKNK